MRRYLVALIGFALLTVMVVASILGYKYFVLRDLHADPRLGQLLRYQEEKIDNSARIAETVLVGDSSLGNAVNAALFGQLTGAPTVNLALTGTFHYGGAYAQLKALASGPNKIRSVVLMYSIDAPASALSLDGPFFMSPMPLVSGLGADPNLMLVKNYIRRLTDGSAATDFLWRSARGRLDITPASDLPLYDYTVSFSQIRLEDNGYRIPLKAAPTRGGFLPLIVELCQKQGWICVYSHGPLVRYALELSGGNATGYFSSVESEFAKLGLTLAAPQPILLTPEQRGDTFFHVHPNFRGVTTRRYAEILLPLLAKPTSAK
jgi:hypothetical protein